MSTRSRGKKDKRGNVAVAHATKTSAVTKNPSPKSMKKRVAVHVCRFIEYTPSAIVAAHLHPDNKHCAIGRQNGNIEIWDLTGSFIQRILPGQGQDTVHSLLWIHDPTPKLSPLTKLRLVSSGYHGWISEWDLESLSIHSKMSAQGFAVWDLAQCAIQCPDSPSFDIFISAACDDGMLRIYRLDTTQFLFQCEFHLPHTKTARCLSTCWGSNEYHHTHQRDGKRTKTKKERRMVFGGTSNGIVLGFDFVTRQQMVSVQVLPVTLNSVRKKSAVKPGITALAALPDHQIAVGSTRGNIDIYDTRFGTLIERNNQTQHTVTRLQYVGDQHQKGRRDILIASCTDGRVLQLIRKNKSFTRPLLTDDQQFTQKMTKQTEFVMTGYHRYHTHDVNVVTVTDKSVVSGGNDCQLVSCGTKDFWTHYICSPLANSTDCKTVQIATNAEWVADVLPISDAAKMDVDDDGDDVDGEKGRNAMGAALRFKLFLHQKENELEVWYLHQTNPVKLIEIKVGFEDHVILCSAISNDGRWICAANNGHIKCWRIQIKEEEKEVKLLKEFECKLRGASTITFSQKSDYLFVTPTVSHLVRGIEEEEVDDEGDDDEKDGDSKKKKKDSKEIKGHRIGVYLDENRDENAQIIRIKLSNKQSLKDRKFTHCSGSLELDQTIHLKEVGNHLISSLKLNAHSTLCAVLVPTLSFGAVVHIESGSLFYGIPRRSGCNISCIEFQSATKQWDSAQKGLEWGKEMLFVVYADNAIKLFEYDYSADPRRLLAESRNVRLHQWVANNAKIWESYNGRNPFAFTDIRFNAATAGKALMVRPEYMFSMQINKTLPSTYRVGVGRGAKRPRIDEMIPSPFGKPEGGKGDEKQVGVGKNATKKKKPNFKRKGSVLRVIRKYDPMVHSQFIDQNALLLIHAPWERVSSKFKDPVYRKLYAT